jgi:hypothetical protein
MFDAEDGNIDLELLGPDDLPVNTSTSFTDDESATTTAEESGEYTVIVYTSDNSTAEYSLDLAGDIGGGTPDPCPDLSSFVERYDSDTDCGISLTELGRASVEFANGDITLTKLGQVSTAFANTAR